MFVAMGVGGMWRVETIATRAQDAVDAVEAERVVTAKRACEDAAETRRILRRMVREGGIASGVAGGEALILSVGDADPEVVAAYRAHLTEQLTPALEQIVNRLPDREWDPDELVCVDVPVEG